MLADSDHRHGRRVDGPSDFDGACGLKLCSFRFAVELETHMPSVGAQGTV